MKLRAKFEGKVNYNGIDQAVLSVQSLDPEGRRLLAQLKKGKTYRITIEEEGD